MFSLYGNQYEEREEHLLLAMFHLALTREIQNAQDIGREWRVFHLCHKWLMAGFNRSEFRYTNAK